MTWHDVKSGAVTLEELVHINNYLDFIDDTRYFSEVDEVEKMKRRR